MHFGTIEHRRYAHFERLRHQAGLVHAFSTRPMDVAAREDERSSERDARRRQMARDLGLDGARLSHCVQVHETRLAIVDGSSAGGALDGFDGAVTDVADAPLMTFSADCPLILAFDPARRVLGLAHASWRCTVARITQTLIRTMADRFGSRPADMHAGIGPSAGPCCYEVKEEVHTAARHLPRPAAMRDAARDDPLFPTRAGRLYFDLWQANAAQLVECDVPAEQIETAGLCTMCQNDLFFSFRREGAGCGHFGLMAALRTQVAFL